MKKMSCLLSIMLLICAGVSVQAIVIRHDTGYTQHAARESAYPAVFYLEQQGPRRVCAATLIHPRWAITAAHCTEETSLASSLADGVDFTVQVAGQTHSIDAIVLHPQYGKLHQTGNPDIEVDLALLRLTDTVDLPRPMSLYRHPDELGKVVTLLGWGYFGIGTQGISVDDGRFRFARNTIHTAGQQLRFTFNDPRVPGSQAIALEGLPGLGDSGGPALLETEQGWALAGVAVGELQQAGREAPRQGMYGAIAIYERISLHLDWIEQTLQTTLDES